MENPEYSDKQKQIIDVAQKLFAEHGFADTSVRDIAKEADVNVAMISYYFGSKEKLLEAIFTSYAQAARLKLETIIQTKELSPTQKIEKLIDHYIDKYFSQPSFHRIIVREQMNLKESPVSAILFEMKRRNTDLIKQLISEGQKKGEFKKNIDISLMMCTMVGTTNQMMSTQNFFREMNNLQSLSDDDFKKLIRKKLSIHLKTLFKAILTYEG